MRIICHLLFLLLANAIFLNSSSSSLPFHKPYSKEQLSLDAQSRPEALQLIWQSDMDEPLPDRSRTPTIRFSPLPIATLRSPHTPPRSQPLNRPRSPSSSSSQISRARHISTLVAESLRLDFDDDEDDLPLHVEFSTKSKSGKAISFGLFFRRSGLLLAHTAFNSESSAPYIHRLQSC